MRPCFFFAIFCIECFCRYILPSSDFVVEVRCAWIVLHGFSFSSRNEKHKKSLKREDFLCFFNFFTKNRYLLILSSSSCGTIWMLLMCQGRQIRDASTHLSAIQYYRYLFFLFSSFLLINPPPAGFIIFYTFIHLFISSSCSVHIPVV